MCSCGQTFDFASERDQKMKFQKGPTGSQGPSVKQGPCGTFMTPCTLSSVLNLQGATAGPLVAFDKIGIPKKATTMREQQLNEYERMGSVLQPWAPTGGP